MAKRKTPKVKDLRPQNVTAEELKQLQELINLIRQGEMQLGNLETKKHGLLHQIVGVQEQIALLQKDFEKTIPLSDRLINAFFKKISDC